MTLRQHVLVLYLANSALDSPVVGWSRYDGTGSSRPTTGDGDEPPYDTGLAALLDGWRLIQASQLLPPVPGHEYGTSFLKHEFLFEKLCTVPADTAPSDARIQSERSSV
ncbi:hypothetical protein OG407_49540 [Streptomyces sp. NBC_01515]|uniref:hypothetical protein n=1 Tax=Streptomyces sp. NBC_01515 TaxID=2903890 RepID=UPI0038656836